MPDLLNRICNADVNLDELIYFCQEENKKLDYVNSFEKYYSIQKILNVINKCEEHKIDYDYLSYWATAYNQIIMASIKQLREYSFLTVIQYEISDIIDSLSFVNTFAEFETVDLNQYIEDFKFYNKIYENIDKYKIFFNISKDKDGIRKTHFLVLDDDKKEFAALTWDDEVKIKGNNEKELSYSEMTNLILDLSEKGYIEF